MEARLGHNNADVNQLDEEMWNSKGFKRPPNNTLSEKHFRCVLILLSKQQKTN